VTQVTEELANARQETEKLTAENESLNKNYEALLKVRFPLDGFSVFLFSNEDEYIK